MAYEQVESVLKHACTFHQHVSEFYAHLMGRIDDERARLLLMARSEHEKRRVDVLKDFVETAPQKVMHTWLTSATDSTVLLKSFDPNIDSSASVDELIELAIGLSERLIKVYEELATRGDPDSVRELFQSFLEEEQQEERQLTIQALRCLDL